MAVYQSENWTFLPDNQTLIFPCGLTEQLPSRINACLLSLVSAGGQTVTYDKLLQEVWGTAHKDACTISSVVSEVRKPIGCGKGDKKIIVTIPKRGYRFLLPVVVIEDDVFQQALKHDTESTSVSELRPSTEDRVRAQ